MTTAIMEEKDRQAQELTELTGGRLRITFSPDAFDPVEGPYLSGGHLFTGSPFNGDGERYNIVLDDRQGDMATQLVAELRRVGNAYMEIATAVEAATK